MSNKADLLVVLLDLLAVGEVVQRPLLVDDTDGSLLCADADTLDFLGGLTQFLKLRVDRVCGLNCSLSVELGRVGDLEQNILHDIGAVRTLEFEGLALEINE